MVLATRYPPAVGRRRKEGTMRFLIKWGLLLIPALALAKPAVAQTPRSVLLSDSQQPGSVIVFPNFTNQFKVPKPQCKNGYLVAWVVDNLDRPIKFDGLIGDVVLRGPDNAAASASVQGPVAGVGHSTAVSAYQGITIQADPALAVGA